MATLHSGKPQKRLPVSVKSKHRLTVLFDVALVFFLVKAVYATRLGDWSTAHYGAFARNAYGLVWHLLDLVPEGADGWEPRFKYG